MNDKMIREYISQNCFFKCLDKDGNIRTTRVAKSEAKLKGHPPNALAAGYFKQWYKKVTKFEQIKWPEYAYLNNLDFTTGRPVRNTLPLNINTLTNV